MEYTIVYTMQCTEVFHADDMTEKVILSPEWKNEMKRKAKELLGLDDVDMLAVHVFAREEGPEK